MAKAKLLIGLSALVVAVLGGFYLYQTKFKKVDPPAEPKGPEGESETPPTQQPNPTSAAPKPKAPAAPKRPVPQDSPPRSSGFVTPASGPASVAVKAPAMGKNIYVLSDAANAYKTAKASASNVYKLYKRGALVGTYLSQEGIFSAVIVQCRSALGTNEAKKVYMRSTEIFSK